MVWNKQTNNYHRKITDGGKNLRYHSHSLIRVQLSVHGKRKAEETTRFSVFPDDMTGVKVEGGHQSWLQIKRREEKCNSSSRGSLQQHGSAIQMCPVQSSDGWPLCSSLSSVVPFDGRLALDVPFPAARSVPALQRPLRPPGRTAHCWPRNSVTW